MKWTLLRRKYIILYFIVFLETIYIFGQWAALMGLAMIYSMLCDMWETRKRRGKI